MAANFFNIFYFSCSVKSHLKTNPSSEPRNHYFLVTTLKTGDHSGDHLIMDVCGLM